REKNGRADGGAGNPAGRTQTHRSPEDHGRPASNGQAVGAAKRRTRAQIGGSRPQSRGSADSGSRHFHGPGPARGGGHVRLAEDRTSGPFRRPDRSPGGPRRSPFGPASSGSLELPHSRSFRFI